VITIVLHAAQVIFAPIPGQALDLVNGYLFGPWIGTIYSIVGIVLGSALVMWLSQRFGRPLVERFVDPQTLDKLDDLTEKRGELVIFLIFLVPFLPDDALCFLAGLTNIPLPKLVLLAAVGHLPGIFVASWVGATANEFKLVHWILVGVLMAVVGEVFWRFKDRIEEACFEWSIGYHVGEGWKMVWGKWTMDDEEQMERFCTPNGLIYTRVEFCAIIEATLFI